MSLMENIKRLILPAETISQEEVIRNIKEQIEKAKQDYESFVELQKNMIDNPTSIFGMEFEKKDKYLDIMEHIKYKDVDLIKDYEYYILKYNILVELYRKVKHIMSNITNEVVSVCFDHDSYNQPICLISVVYDNSGKILLVKNTLPKEDYLRFDFIIEDNENGQYKIIEIKDIAAQEQSTNHEVQMLDYLIDVIADLKQKNIINANKIIADSDLNLKQDNGKTLKMLRSKGFQEEKTTTNEPTSNIGKEIIRLIKEI